MPGGRKQDVFASEQECPPMAESSRQGEIQQTLLAELVPHGMRAVDERNDDAVVVV